MANSIFATAKATVSISTTTTAPATFDAAGYAALTYSQICPLESIGAFGTTFETVQFDDICTGLRTKIKGINDNGEMEVVAAYDDTNAGQGYAVVAAKDTSTANYNFKITFPNKQNPTGTDAVFYFSGKVMSATNTPGKASDVVTRTFNIGINTAIIEVASTAGA